MFLSQLLDPKSNNLGFFRVVAALMVIYGHAPAFVAHEQRFDVVAELLGFDYAGSLAVKFFFLLSGLLITNSLIAQPALGGFLIKRAARIFPGLLVCLCVTVFFVGPLFTSLEIAAYFRHSQTWQYLLHNILLYPMQWYLPGVFNEGMSSVVNGSLWTLPLEVICYLSAALFYYAILMHRRGIACVILIGIIAVIFCGTSLWPIGILKFKESLLLGGCFCIGSLTAILQRHLILGIKGVMVGMVAAFLLWQTPLQQVAFYGLLFYTCLYLSGTSFFTRFLQLPGDPSYGIYIYGFVIQQCIANTFPTQGILSHQITAAIIATAAGYLSWYVVEKPVLSFIKKR